MKKTQHVSDDVYSQLLDELVSLQLQINTAKPINLKALLDRQLVSHEVITKKLTRLAIDNKIVPRDELQSIVRPPYVVTFLLQAESKGAYNVTIHNVSLCCKF
jgi:hypothetical protein